MDGVSCGVGVSVMASKSQNRGFTTRQMDLGVFQGRNVVPEKMVAPSVYDVSYLLKIPILLITR